MQTATRHRVSPDMVACLPPDLMKHIFGMLQRPLIRHQICKTSRLTRADLIQIGISQKNPKSVVKFAFAFFADSYRFNSAACKDEFYTIQCAYYKAMRTWHPDRSWYDHHTFYVHNYICKLYALRRTDGTVTSETVLTGAANTFIQS